MNPNVIVVDTEESNRARDEYCAGSDILNWKRNHVINCVKSLLAMLTPEDLKGMREMVGLSGFSKAQILAEDELRIRLEDDRYSWVATDIVFGLTSKRHLRLTCVHRDCREVYNSDRSNTLDMENVTYVFDSIGVLISGLCKLYPSLTGRVQPILEAGRKT